MTLKRQELDERDKMLAELKSDFVMRRANMSEENEKEKWELKNQFDEDRHNFLATITSLEENVKSRSEQLTSAEEHIQMLEKQLSDAETLNSNLKLRMETCSAEVEMCQADVASYKAQYDEAEDRAADAEARCAAAEKNAKKVEEKLCAMKAVLADYEVQLDDAGNVVNELRSERLKSRDLAANNSKFEIMLQSSEEEVTKQRKHVEELTQQVEDYQRQLNVNEEILQERVNEARAINDQTMLQFKEESEAKLKKMFEMQKKKIKELCDEHSAELLRIREEQEWRLAEQEKSHR